ncbi:D-alanyl-D-alanine carboxypeptidase [Microbacterium sp. NPDC090007]|uniref:D-alanyl-D-alanine carboxypeptidase n=1 Tax=Microbacterium sp. NPDC090007 TaxID=3364204 RepID=UPI0037F22F6B
MTAPDTLGDFADLLNDAPGAPRSDGRAGRIALLVFLGVVLATLAAAGGYVWWASAASLPAPTVVAQAPGVAPGPAAAVSMPGTGQSVLAVSGGEGFLNTDGNGVLAASGDGSALPMASITKLITALVVLDAHPLDSATDPGPTIAFTEADTDLYDQFYVRGAVISRMPDGLRLSLHDSLATMLLPSSANYAVAVARWGFGSEDAFVRAARSWLSANGLENTRIVDATGIDDRNTSTAGDLLTLGRLAAANPTIAALADTRSVRVDGAGTVTNTNGLLGTLGISGLKTGNLGDGTFNLLFTSTLDVGIGSPLQIVGVRLGGETHDSTDADVVRMLQTLKDGFHDLPVGTVGDEIGEITTAWGSQAALVLSRGATLRTWSDTPVSVVLDTSPPQTYTEGEVVGRLTWTAGERSATSDVKISGAIDEPSLWWRLTHPGELG